MILDVGNPGKALVHITRARAVMEGKYASMANCRACDEETKLAFKEAAEFFAGLIKAIREETDG